MTIAALVSRRVSPLLVVIGTVAGGCATAPPQTVSTLCGGEEQVLRRSSGAQVRVANACVVGPDRTAATLWRGAKPDVAGAADLVALGVRTVVNLELMHDDLRVFQNVAIANTASAEIRYFRVRDWEPLALFAPRITDEHVAHFLAITRTQLGPIFVHCRSGQNRTGVMVGAYQIVNGSDPARTIKAMKDFGGFWSAADSAYLESLAGERAGRLEPMIRAWEQKLRPEALIRCSADGCAAVPP